jgi:hypothetical protein
MADNTDNTPGEIIPAKDAGTTNSNQEIENMEVHHHSSL